MLYSQKSKSRYILIIALMLALSVVLAACGEEPPPIPEVNETASDSPSINSTTSSQSSLSEGVGSTDSQYKEAPILAELVAAGQLPPVDERLPIEPLVVEVQASIGKYGGTWTTWDTGFDTGSCKEMRTRQQTMLWRNPVTAEFEPNIVVSTEYSDDFKALTVRLREGLRWSDGELVTSEDALFWFDDVQANEDLLPQLNNNFTTVNAEGERSPMKVEIVDDFTYRYVFLDPNPAFVDKLASNVYLEPKHYLQQFHPTYNDNAADEAEAAGFETWMAYFGSKADRGISQTNPDLPMLRQWVLQSVDSSNSKIYTRNPYFWKVDAEGNQLPYIDKYSRVVVESGEIGVARGLTGEWTLSTIGAPDLPLVKQNEEKGGYQVHFFPQAVAADGFAFGFNYTHPDPELREVFNDLRFRRAISHAFDRDEWNELFHAGLGEPRQAIIGPDTSFYEEGIDKLYIEHDPDLSNQLLDEMGLVWPDGEDYRQLPSGKPFIIETAVMDSRANRWEIVQQYWKSIGIGLEFKPVTAQLLREQLQTNELPIGSWGGGGQDEFYAHSNRPIRYMPPWHWPQLAQGGALWGIWHDTNGEEGEEPPQLIKDLFSYVDQWMQEPYGSERYLELGREITRINAENLWWFGVVGYDPYLAAIDKDIRNIPATPVATHICIGGVAAFQPEQFYFDVLD